MPVTRTYSQDENGQIFNETLELNLSNHCNLNCRSCSHVSPVLSKRFAVPEKIEHDLNILKKYYHVRTVRIVGGEPLLHPDLVSILNRIRSIQIASHVQVVTNGVLLSRMGTNFWSAVDSVEISVYPGFEISASLMKELQSKGNKFGVELRTKFHPFFRTTYSERGAINEELVSRIYRTCTFRWVTPCHTVENGFFYRCPQSHFIPKLLSKENDFASTEDGLIIDDRPSFGYDLLGFLNSQTPPNACKNCLGSVGRTVPHSQIEKTRWRSFQNFPTEELLDRDALSVSEVLFQENHNFFDASRSHARN